MFCSNRVYSLFRRPRLFPFALHAREDLKIAMSLLIFDLHPSQALHSMDNFRVRLNCVDHYQGVPTELEPPLFQKSAQQHQRLSPKVPIIRVFGSTPTGQKVCAHIHGAFPYLYVDYSEGLATEEGQASQLQ